jgi:ribosome maturation factor RimP
LTRAVKTNKIKARKKGSGSQYPRPPRMNEKAVAAKVRDLAMPLCEAEGLDLVHVEFQREAVGRILRLYIDKPNGITLDDCVGISRQMGDLLDVNLAEIGPYSLEVTSPGSDRPLSRKTDFEKFLGNRAKIKTVRSLDGQKNFNGILSGISGEQVLLQVGENLITIAIEDISNARLVDYNGEI